MDAEVPDIVAKTHHRALKHTPVHGVQELCRGAVPIVCMHLYPRAMFHTVRVIHVFLFGMVHGLLYVGRLVPLECVRNTICVECFSSQHASIRGFFPFGVFFYHFLSFGVFFYHFLSFGVFYLVFSHLGFFSPIFSHLGFFLSFYPIWGFSSQNASIWFFSSAQGVVFSIALFRGVFP